MADSRRKLKRIAEDKVNEAPKKNRTDVKNNVILKTSNVAQDLCAQSSKLTGEHGSKLTGEHGSKLTGEHGSKLTGEHGSKLTGEHGSKLTGEHGSKLTGEHGSKLTGEHGSKLTGDHGTAPKRVKLKTDANGTKYNKNYEASNNVRDKCGQKRKISVTNKDYKAPKRAKTDTDVTNNDNSELGTETSNNLQDIRRKNRKRTLVDKVNTAPKRVQIVQNDINGQHENNENSELDNNSHLGGQNIPEKCIPDQLIDLMYRSDLSVLCSLRKPEIEHKYSSLSIELESCEIDKFNSLVLRYNDKSIHIHIDNVDSYYTDNGIGYAKLFVKDKRGSYIDNYFNSYVEYLIKCFSENLSNNIEYLVIYTNSCIDMTEELELVQRGTRNFYPFKFYNIDKESGLLKDILHTNDVKQRGFYQFFKNEATTKDLLKRLEFSPAMLKAMKEKQFPPEFENEVKESFVDKLVFAVNQPYREELNRIVKSEIGEGIDCYVELQESVLHDLITRQNHANSIPEIVYGFNLLITFVHEIFLNEDFTIIFLESNGTNNISVYHKDKIILINAHNSEKSIGFSKLFPVKKGKSSFSIDNYFSLYIEESEKIHIEYFIAYTNASLDITEEMTLKKGQSKDFYPLKFDAVDIEKEEYKILEDCSCTNNNVLYQFSKEEPTREALLKLLKLPVSLLKKKGIRSDEKEKEIKKFFLDKLIFAVSQPNEKGTNPLNRDEIEKRIKRKKVPYNYDELHEISLRWLESREFGPLSKEIMEKLLRDIKYNKSSYQKIAKNIDEEIKFTKSVVGSEGTPAFNKFLDFLTKGQGEKHLKVMKKEGISLINVSSILGGARGKASTAFEGLYYLLFDKLRNKTQHLKNFEKEGINLANISSILNKARDKAPKALKELHDLWFDQNEHKSRYLKTLEREGINLATISGILSGARANAFTTFKELYDLWFNENGTKTQYLKTLEEERINLTIMSSILSGSGANAAKAFKGLYDLWFNADGTKTEYLINLEEENINLRNVSSILSGAGANSATAFKELYNLWFNEDGTKTQYLKTLKKEEIELTNISSILHGVGPNAPKAFKEIYQLWFDKAGNKTKYLETLKGEGIDLTNVSSILHGARNNATKAFISLYNLWFDDHGNKTKHLKTLEEGININNMSNILHGVGTNAATAFKNLYNLWFDSEGNKSHYLKNLEEKGLNLTNMSSILGGSGTNIATAFKDLYDLWLDENGNETHYLKTLDKEGVSLTNISSILGGAGMNAATAFKNLYNLWFDDKEQKTQYLKTLEKEGINVANISSILHGSGANAVTAFKDLYTLWFDEKENKTEYLNTLEKNEINLANVSSILNGAGVKAAAAFKSLYHMWIDGKENKTEYLNILERGGMTLANVSSIIHGAGANASKAFKELFYTFFDEKGNRKEHLKHFVDEKDGERNFKLTNLSSILSKAGTKARYAFETLHDVCFDDEGNRTNLLDDFYKAGFKPSNLSSALCGTGCRAFVILKRLHNVCFNNKREKTKLLDDFCKVGFKPGNLCSMLSGAKNSLEDNLKKFHYFCFVGDTKSYLNRFLNEDSFTLSKLSKILHASGANICSALTDFHNVCFDEKGESHILCDFRNAGFTPSNLSNILSMSGNNATMILAILHKVFFNDSNYLNHFLAEENLFTPKDLSKILHGVGIHVCSIFEKLHNLCFNKRGNKRKYLKKTHTK